MIVNKLDLEMNKDTNFTSYEEGASSSAIDEKTNLIINYLPQTLTDSQLYDTFSGIGLIKTCRIIKDFKTGYSHGFGFVEYENSEDATRAIEELNNLSIQHKRIKVSYARPAGTEIKDTNLYIQNIPRSYSIEDLERIFAEFGQIVQKNLLRDKITGTPKGVGFIRYDKKTEADAAIANMNGHIPPGGTQPLNVRVAEEHGKIKASNMTVFSSVGGGFNQAKMRGGSYNNRNLVGVPQTSRGGGGGGGGGSGGYNNSRGKMPFQRGARRYNPFDSRMPDMRQHYM